MPEREVSWPATRPGVRRIPMPSVLPTITARPKPTPRMRSRPAGRPVVALKIRSRLQRHEHHGDGASGVARGVARPSPLELHVPGFPVVHLRGALRGVLDGSAGEMDDDDVPGMRVKALARADLHARAQDRHAIVLEERLDAEARRRLLTGLRALRRRASGSRGGGALGLDDDERTRRAVFRAERRIGGPVRLAGLARGAIPKRHDHRGRVRGGRWRAARPEDPDARVVDDDDVAPRLARDETRPAEQTCRGHHEMTHAVLRCRWSAMLYLLTRGRSPSRGAWSIGVWEGPACRSRASAWGAGTSAGSVRRTRSTARARK